MSDDRLYGLPEAEELYFDLEDVLDEVEGEEGMVVVHEWTVHPPEHHLPKGAEIVALVVSSVEAYGDVAWAWPGDINPENDFTSLASAEALRQAIAATITMRMADRHVATWDVEWWLDDDGSFQHEARKRR